jgi:surface protein
MPIRYGSAPRRFQSTWDTTQAGSNNDQVVLPLVSAGSYDFSIDWGDGKTNRNNITTYNQAEVTHTYDNTGIYEIRIVGGITGWQFNNQGDDDKILTISSWGPMVMVNDAFMFYGCFFLESTATDSLILGNTIYRMFQSVYNLGNQGNMNDWDTSSVTDMREVFVNATGFNQPVGGWDTSNVTNMQGMFTDENGGMTFDQDIGSWDVSNVTSMYQMFRKSHFVTNGRVNLFNNGGSPSISGWNTSKVTNMSLMFEDCSQFNQPIGTWDVSKVTNMDKMFAEAVSFDQDLSNWDVSGVTNMAYMFRATPFTNGGSDGITGWDTSSVTTMRYMFLSCDEFNIPIGSWNTSSVTNMEGMFQTATGFNQPLSGWNTSNVTDMGFMFYKEDGGMTFDQDIGNWDTSNVESMDYMFAMNANVTNVQRPYFNNGGSSSISGWNTGKVTTFYRMFEGNTGINQPIGAWDTSSVTDIRNMFYRATAFDQDLSNWVVTGVTSATQFLKTNSLSTTNYDLTLSGWAQQSGDLQAGVSIDFGTSQYSIATGEQYKEILSGAGWTIVDGGSV